MIVSFADRESEALYHGDRRLAAKRIPLSIMAVAMRKLDLLNAAHDLRDLRSPPANRLEALAGDLKGYDSIRINDQWRIIFRWLPGEAHEVGVVDYH